MNDRVERTEDDFFAALVAADVERLAQVLAEDFAIVDLMAGAVADRDGLVSALRERIVEFERVDVVERSIRRYGDTAVVVGRTDMAGSFGGNAFTAASRYTHVLVRDSAGEWHLVSAQGTQIAE